MALEDWQPSRGTVHGAGPVTLPDQPLKRPRLPSSFTGWLAVFGPGAVIASLTIGAGELIFSTRGGALFGYKLLWLFSVILLLKWALVFASARHIVLSGFHPFQRWSTLPGPVAWLPLVFFLLALFCFPIWVAFHAGTIGTLIAGLTGTTGLWGGSAYFLWGSLTLSLALLMVFRGGYRTLERTQLVITILMLLSVSLALFFLPIDWSALLQGFILPQPLQYPPWVGRYPEIASRPAWVEIATYVGVIGGSSYDYLAYVSYLREKNWGAARAPAHGPGSFSPTPRAHEPGGSRGHETLTKLDYPSGQTSPIPRKNIRVSSRQLPQLEECTLQGSPHEATARTPLPETPGAPPEPWPVEWIRAPLIDCALSFAAVYIFTTVFVASGAAVLGPAQKVPAGTDLLSLQAAFVTPIHPWLRYVYFIGAFLTIFGTLYGTIEVAPTILREIMLVFPEGRPIAPARLRQAALCWASLGGLIVLIGRWLFYLGRSGAEPPGLIALLIPANLFTGVLGCGLVCWLNLWADRRFLPRAVRMGKLLTALSFLGGLIFIVLGLKGYWDHSRWRGLLMLLATVAVGWGTAAWRQRRRSSA